MAMALRVYLFEQGGSANSTFRDPFDRLDAVKVIELSTRWEELQAHLHSGQVEAVAVNLDAQEGRNALYAIQRICEVAPGVPVLGVSSSSDPEMIIQAMRAGCSQFVRSPIDMSDLSAAIRRVRQTRAPNAVESARFCVMGSAGGAGATTIAANLAIELARLIERRVAIVDMNLQFGDVACAFDASPKHSLVDLCRSGANIDRTMMETALVELPCNVSLLARPESIVGLSDEIPPDAVEQCFRVLEQMFPFVVADLPRLLSPMTAAAIIGADRVLIVTQLAVPYLRNATRAFEYLLSLGYDEDRIEILLNRCNANHERIKPAEVEKHFGRKVFATVPNDYKRMTTSRDLGHPIVTDAPNSPARLAIREVARQLAAGRLGEASAKQESSLFGMWRRKKPRAAAAARG